MSEPTESPPMYRLHRRLAGIEELVPEPPALDEVVEAARLRRSRRNRVETSASVLGLILVVAVAGVIARGVTSGVGSAQPSPTELWPRVSVDNETSVVVTVLVNGNTEAQIPPFTDEEPTSIVLPARPWHFVLTSPSGTSLLEFNVSQSDYFDSQVGFGTTTDVPCGYLSIRVGGAPPHGGPARSPASGKCD